MDEQTQQEFISWLSEQLGVQSEDELQQQMNQMGDDGIQQAFQVFQKEKQTPMNKEGGKLDYLVKLQQGGMIANNYKSSKGQLVTDSDLSAYSRQGMNFGTKQAMGDWLDTWGNNSVTPETQPVPVAGQPKTIRRYNQSTRSYETVPVQTIMAESNTQTVGQPGAWGKWDTSAFKKQVTPQDTIGASSQVRQNVQQGWDTQGVNPVPKSKFNSTLTKFAKGGSIKDKGQDGKTAVGVTNWVKGQDKATALKGRKDKGQDTKTALKKVLTKGKDGKTAVGITNWVKGADAATGLNRRKDSGTNTHTALNKK